MLKTYPTPENAREALITVEKALEEGAKEQLDWGSNAYRIRGEAYELLENPSEALHAYEIALALNPKIGIKKGRMPFAKL